MQGQGSRVGRWGLGVGAGGCFRVGGGGWGLGMGAGGCFEGDNCLYKWTLL